jgi:hypothetical protein
MSKKQNQTPRDTKNLDDEINIQDFPYYSTIPIEEIALKQKRRINSYNNNSNNNNSNNINKTQPLLTSPGSNPTSPSSYSDIIIPRQESINVYDGAPFRPLPTFNLVPVENEKNTYQLDVKSTEDALSDLLNNIEANNHKLYEQQQYIAENEETIRNQSVRIEESKNIINNNTGYINQQIAAYNHNVQIIEQQISQYNVNNNEILKQGQIIMGLNNQVQQLQSQITQLHLDLESYQQQIAYHGTMLGAFNTMIQNPEYFTQLMSMSMNNNVNMYENYDTYQATYQAT